MQREGDGKSNVRERERNREGEREMRLRSDLLVLYSHSQMLSVKRAVEVRTEVYSIWDTEDNFIHIGNLVSNETS